MTLSGWPWLRRRHSLSTSIAGASAVLVEVFRSCVVWCNLGQSSLKIWLSVVWLLDCVRLRSLATLVTV